MQARHLWMAAWLAMTAAIPSAAADDLSPAMEAYQRISVLRDRNSEVLWREGPVASDTLLAVRADLQAGLAQLDEPVVHGLGEGNRYLRWRRYNFLRDLVKAEARLGDREAAIAAMQAMDRMAWLPRALDDWADDVHVAPLLDDPRVAVLRARQAIAKRWHEAPALSAPADGLPDQASRVAALSLIWSHARDGFAWFDNVPDLDWDQAYLDALPEVIAASSTETYYRALRRFVARLADGHSNVYLPDALAERLQARPGVRTARIGDRVLVTSISDAGLADVRVGDVLQAIDGEPVDAWAGREVAPYVSASTPQDRAVRIYDHELLSGPADRPVALTLQRADGVTYTVQAPRSRYIRSAHTPPPPLEWHGDVAVLRARQFEDDAALRAFEGQLDRVMASSGLVIDLRGNGGGSSGHGYDILTWLSREPLTTPESSYREHAALDRARGNGTIEWRVMAATPWKRDRERVFEGRVAVLVDARTFSAAEDTAAAFQLMRRGTILGTASGGSTGQPWMFDLPGGGMARLCVKRDTWPAGGSFVGVGVVPDIIVVPDADDIRAGRDPVLARALDAVRAAP